jgi:import inner membrane translocase subunit TIM44
MKVIKNVRRISRLGTVVSQKPHSNQLVLLNQALLQQLSLRTFSAENQKPKNFFTTFVDTLKDELKKNKDLQEHKKILNERLKELNEADALKEARQKFIKVEKETAQSSEVIRHRVKEFKDHFEKVITDLQKTDTGKKLSVAGQEALKQAKIAAEFLEKTAKDIGDTQVYQQVSSVISLYFFDKICILCRQLNPFNVKLIILLMLECILDLKN